MISRLGAVTLTGLREKRRITRVCGHDKRPLSTIVCAAPALSIRPQSAYKERAPRVGIKPFPLAVVLLKSCPASPSASGCSLQFLSNAALIFRARHVYVGKILLCDRTASRPELSQRDAALTPTICRIVAPSARGRASVGRRPARRPRQCTLHAPTCAGSSGSPACHRTAPWPDNTPAQHGQSSSRVREAAHLNDLGGRCTGELDVS